MLARTFSKQLIRFQFASFQEKLQQRQLKQAQDEYKKEIEYLASKTTFTMLDFRQRTVDTLAKLRKGFKAKMTQGFEQTEQQMTTQKQIMNAMFDEELLNPNEIDGQRKAQIAMVAQVTTKEVNDVIRNFKNMESMQKWIRQRRENNEPLPESQEEFQYRFRQDKPMSKSFLKFEFRRPKYSRLQAMQRLKWSNKV